MLAVVITHPGGPNVLEVREVETPRPGLEEVRVRVRASALNRADLLQRMGNYPAPPGAPSDIPGLEFAGEIDEVGPSVSTRRIGQRVFGIVGGGGCAEYVTVHERAVATIPSGMAFEDAAAVPEAFVTAHDALFTLGNLRSGARVLIHAIGSGVGLAAVQLAHAMHAEIFGTARTEDKLVRAGAYGVTHSLSPDGFDRTVSEQTAGAGVHLVIDFVGAPYLNANLRALSDQGRLIVVGLMGGAREEIDLSLVLRKRITVIGTVLRSRPLEQKIQAIRAFEAEVVPLLARGVVRPVVDTIFPLERVREAHERMAANSNFGKIVLTV